MRTDVKALLDAVVQAVREYVRETVEPITATLRQHDEAITRATETAVGAHERVDQVIERVAAIPAPRDGVDGKDGRDGVDGKDGIDGKDGAPGETGAPGRDGVDGLHGKDGRDGIDGKDGAPGRDGEHGRDGRDALELEILSGIDPKKAYPRGTVAAFRGGLIRAERRTSPVDGSLESAGWRVILRGVASTELRPSDDGRSLAVRLVHTDGEVVEQRLLSPAIIYREIWREGDYEAGDAVTFGGSLWIALRATSAKPGDGSPDWRLAVKKGRDGRDAGK